MAEELTIRQNDEQSAYEISWQGKVWDSVTFRQLLTCESPQILMEHTVCHVERRIRVHRFVRALKYSEPPQGKEED
jgi:hypothetical protein